MKDHVQVLLELQAANARIERLVAEVSAHDAEMAKVLDEAAQAREERDAARADRDESGADAERWGKRAVELEKEIAAVRAEMAEMHAASDTYVKNLGDMAIARDTALRELAELRASRDATEAALREHCAMVHRLANGAASELAYIAKVERFGLREAGLWRDLSTTPKPAAAAPSQEGQ